MNENGSEYRYALVLLREDGSVACQAAVDVDWESAEEWTRLQGIRGGLSIAEGFGAPCAVVPTWHESLGRPYLGGFQVQLAVDGCGPVSEGFTSAYFRGLADAAASRAVKEGRLEEDEPYRYLAAAFPREGAPTAEARGEDRAAAAADRKGTEPSAGGEGRGGTAADRPDAGAAAVADRADAGTAAAAVEAGASHGVDLRAAALLPAVALRRGTLSRFLDASRPEADPESTDLPVFLPERVLEEASELALAAGAVETGGVLIGHLHQDASRPETFVQVTAQVPARHVEADSTRLSFTGETWTEVRSAIALRGRDEVMLGWWHSHPVHEWCGSCPPDRQRRCPLARDFLSAHDRALHRTVFPRAWSLALVINRVATGPPTASLFGWRRGSLEVRGFHLFEGDRETRQRRRVAVPGGGTDVS